MTLRTSFTELFSVTHPIALAPMGGISGGAVAAAVSNGGGLGLIGGGHGDSRWLDRELEIVAAGTDQPWGVGFLNWAADVAAVGQALARQPSAVMLSFGDPTPFLGPIRDAGVALIMQVTDLGEARQAVAAGADVIVAQGAEAGGHGGRRATLPFVPAVVDLAAPTPVLAAGGIADGRGIAAALALGAAGALLGTRFLATPEVLVTPSVTKAVLEGGGEDTERSTISDIARGSAWPSRYPARTLRHPFYDRWRGREDELTAGSAARRDCQQAYQEAVARGDLPRAPVWAGEAIDLIDDVIPAADLVGLLAAQAEQALDRIARVRAAR
ncbi:MAG TPA: nitronate monooxygenase [Streptosporangiaceae bacterium]|jgi:nitronate monooxygenase